MQQERIIQIRPHDDSDSNVNKHTSKGIPMQFKPVEGLQYGSRDVAIHGEFFGGRKVFTITSTKGGIGKTTISTNLAYLLSRMPGEPSVVIVDLMKSHGNVATRLLVPSNINVKSWEEHMKRDDALSNKVILNSLVFRHSRTGLHIVPAVMPHEELTPELGEYVLRHLTQMFDYVVCDISSASDKEIDQDLIKRVINMSNRTFAVIDYDNATISDMQTRLTYWYKANIDIDKISILTNFEPSKNDGNSIGRADMQSYFSGLDFAGALPEVCGIRAIQNKGKLVTEDPKHTLTQQMKTIFAKYEPTISSAAPKMSIFRKWLGGKA
jgi:MinD-like ATPase involved in chromosome partitioning or flagellar assembly